MNITVLANRDVAANLALNLLLPELASTHRLTVFLSSHVGSAKALPEGLARLKFFEQTLFNDIVFPLLRPDGGGLTSFRGLDRLLVRPMEDLNRINSQTGLERLRASEPDLVLSIRYGGILKQRAIAVPERGVLNLHSGLLPDFRGVMATFWAMLQGAETIGTCLHFIADGTIDTGDVVAVHRRPLDHSKSYLWNVLDLYPGGCRTLLDAVDQLARGDSLETQPQEAGGAYYTFPTEHELRAFYDAGFRLWDDHEMAEIVSRWRAPDAGQA